jgi:hypothetical protein
MPVTENVTSPLGAEGSRGASSVEGEATKTHLHRTHTGTARSPQITATIPNAIHSFIGLDSSCAADSTGKA